MKSRLGVLVALVLCCSMPHAADIYRWVDETGRTQFGDTVPERYKASARKLDNPPEPTPKQRSDAAARVDSDKSAASRNAGGKSGPAKAGVKPAPAAAPAVAAAQKAPDSECARQQQLYRASQECFAPYRQANGSIKAEAYKVCTEVVDPSPRCGIETRK
jgi:hypothetical protein